MSDAPPEAPAESSKAKTKTAPRANPMEQFVIFAAFLAGMLILIDPAARDLTGAAVGFVLMPTIGFNHALPVISIMLASTVMVLVTSGVRHYFTDYLKQARNQEVMKAFQKEMRSARKENNLHKMKKLTEKNKDLMQLQAEQSSAQLKPMALTMVVVIPIFAWLLTFADPGGAAVACDSPVRVPWDARWCMDAQIGFSPLSFLPRWVALYSLFSIPLGQVVARVLKARDLEQELAAQKGA